MELRRLRRAVRGSWGIVAVIALLGVLGALVFTSLQGSSRDQVYEATAAFRFDPVEGETIADLADEIEANRSFAAIAAEDLLEQNPDSLIEADLAEARLLFVARGTNPGDASELAQMLLQTFLDIDPTIGGDAVDDRLAELEAEASDLRVQIEQLTPEVTAEEEDRVEQLEFLQQQIDGIQGRLVELLILEAAAATAEERQAIVSERQIHEERLAQFEAEVEALEAAVTPELSAEEELLLATLESRMLSLQSEYERLYLRKLGVTGTGSVEPVSVVNITPEPLDPVLNSAIGLVGGLLIAIFAVSMVARTRRTVWLPEDVPIPVLGDIPARAVGSNVAEAWYDSAEPGPRKTAIQALRSAVQAQIRAGGSTLALTGFRVPSEGVQAVAADLAAAMASAGDSVLLIDANYDSRSALGEYRAGGSSLADAFRFSPEAPEFAAQIRDAVESAYVVRPNLAVIPSGPPPTSPADALAGRQFRSLIAAAESHYETIVVVVDEIDTPTAQVAMQRLQSSLLMLTPGTVTGPEVSGILRDADRLKVSMLGAVFLGKRDRLASLFRRRTPRSSAVGETASTEKSRRSTPEPAAPSPISRLYNYPMPNESRSALAPTNNLSDLAGRLQADEVTVSDLGSELLDAITGSSPERAYEAVSEYVVARTEDMVTARPGQEHLSAELIEDVQTSGFMTLRPLKSHRTVASWLTMELQSQLNEASALEITGAMERVLLKESETLASIDDWLTAEFFAMHLARTGGEPSVWHLTSPNGTVSVLVGARRFDEARVERLLDDVVGSTINELERYRKAAVSRGDDEQAGGVFDRQIEDVRRFESALKSLIEGGPAGKGKKGERGMWSPDWSQGTRANLAPMQQAGVLPFEVLSQDEVSGLAALA